MVCIRVAGAVIEAGTMHGGGVSRYQEDCLEEVSWVNTPSGLLRSVSLNSERAEPGSQASLLSLSALFLQRNNGTVPPFLMSVLRLSSFCLPERKLPQRHHQVSLQEIVPQTISFYMKQAKCRAQKRRSPLGSGCRK